MNRYYVPIGCQCTVAVSLRDLKLNRETLPFDWIFIKPGSVYLFLQMLLVDKLPVEDIVIKHFLKCDQMITRGKYKNHYCTTCDKYSSLACLNSEYDIVFLHDTVYDENGDLYQDTVDKYIRRFNRLKKTLENNMNEIQFIYVSPSYIDFFRFNNKKVIVNENESINNINNLMIDVNPNHNIYIMNTKKINKIQKKKAETNDSIHIIQIKPKKQWKHLVPIVKKKLINSKIL